MSVRGVNEPLITTEELASRLHQLGFLIVPHGHHIGIRGPLYTSVRVQVEQGVLHLEPRFGGFARTTATLLKTLGSSVLAFAAISSRLPGTVTGLLAFLALALWGYDALRYTLTESASVQVRQAFNALLMERAMQVPNATMAALHAPPPVLDPSSRAHSGAEMRR
jgi:hypothetical protein